MQPFSHHRHADSKWRGGEQSKDANQMGIGKLKLKTHYPPALPLGKTRGAKEEAFAKGHRVHRKNQFWRGLFRVGAVHRQTFATMVHPKLHLCCFRMDCPEPQHEASHILPTVSRSQIKAARREWVAPENNRTGIGRASRPPVPQPASVFGFSEVATKRKFTRPHSRGDSFNVTKTLYTTLLSHSSFLTHKTFLASNDCAFHDNRLIYKSTTISLKAFT